MKPLYQPKLVYLEQRTPEWLHWRDSGVGGSESAYVAGVSYRGNILELYQHKLKLIPDIVPNQAMLRGQLLEDDARTEFSLDTKLPVEPICLEHPKFPFIKASLDGISDDGSVIVEIKCPGFKTHSEALEGKIRAYYYCQMQHQLLASGARMCYYFSYTDIFHDDKRAKKLIPVYRDEPFIERLTQRLIKFWESVETQTPPDIALFHVKDAGLLNGLERTDPAWFNVTNEIVEYKTALDDAEKNTLNTEESLAIIDDLKLQLNARIQTAENLMQRKKQVVAEGNGVRLERILNGNEWTANVILLPTVQS